MKLKIPSGDLLWLSPLWVLSGSILGYLSLQQGVGGLALMYGGLAFFALLTWFDLRWAAVPLIGYFLLAAIGGFLLLLMNGPSWRLASRLMIAAYSLYAVWNWYRSDDATSDLLAQLGPSLPVELAERGWKPHRFPESNVVVFLPPAVAAAFDTDGTLKGITDSKAIEFYATLHAREEFNENPEASLDAVSHLADAKGLQTLDKGTYRYFYDPTDEDPFTAALRYWVVGIPGAVVVVSILADHSGPRSSALQEVWDEIPQIVGAVI